MQKTKIYRVRLTIQQVESLNKLRDYDVNVSQFIRAAIKEKIKNDWPKIKEQKEKVKLPF